MKLLLDTAVLGEICHPRKFDDVRAWFARTAVDHEVMLSEVADYELRRELLRIDAHRSIARFSSEALNATSKRRGSAGIPRRGSRAAARGTATSAKSQISLRKMIKIAVFEQI